MKVAAFLLVFVVMFSSVVFADYIDAGVDGITKTNSTVFIRGFVKLDNTSGVSNVNVSASLDTSNGSSITASTGYFEINLTAPVTAGDYPVVVTTNTSLSKTFPTHARNISTANLTFIGNKPPFSNASSFLVNVTFDGLPVSEPLLQVFNPNGNISSGWTIVNVTPYDQQTVTYNVTVPGSADGEYALIVEKGAGFLFFIVKTSLVVAVDIQDTSNASATVFAPSESVRLSAKVRNDDGPISDATVTAFITLPNSTVRNVTMTQTSINGTYKLDFDGASAADVHDVRVVTSVEGREIEGSGFFEVKGLEGKLDTVKDFFFEFGGSSAFSAGGQVSFNVLIYNTSSDMPVVGSLPGAPGFVNCSGIIPTKLKNVQTGEEIPFNQSNISVSLGNFFEQAVCKINFTAPTTNGIYQLSVNALVGDDSSNTTTPATGYFSVQSYVLKISPISSVGGGDNFKSSLVPGSNATFEITARNLSNNGTAVTPTDITSINLTRITPLDFLGGGQNDITEIAYTITAGTATTNPRVDVVLPENQTGPFNIEFEAEVSSGTIRGTAFYFAKYVEGFLFPAGFFGGPGGSSGGDDFKCEGSATFSAMLYDVKTGQGAKNVVFNSIQEAREELTGRSVIDYLTITSSTVSDSDGNANVTVSFSGATSYSGFYFFLINVTTSDGKFDIIPGGFECRSLNFFPNAKGEDTQDFSVGPNATLSVVVSNIKNVAVASPYRVENGTVSVTSLENFDQAMGRPNFYAGPVATFPLIDGNATINLSAQNFSLSRWPSGFNGLKVKVCDNSTDPDTCDTSFGGFRSVSFDAFFDFSYSMPSQVVPLENVTFTINARTNVTENGVTNTISKITATMGQPWAGASETAYTNSTLVADGWNNSADVGFEKWNVTVEIPANVRKGDNMLTIRIKDYRNETTDVEFFLTVVKYSVFVPDGEGVFMDAWFFEANHTDANNVSDVNSTYGINLSYVNATFNVNSKSAQACGLFGFNTTRFGPSNAQVGYSPTTAIVIIDNGTAGTYDTAIFRDNSTGEYAIAYAANRSLAGAGFDGLYLRRVMDCGFAEIINATATPTGFGSGFGGQHQKLTNFDVPFIVKKSNVAAPSMTVDISQIVLQEDLGGGRGGFGFQGFLSASNFTKVVGTTDANGIAFLRVNVSISGSYGLIWNLTDGSETDVAEFSQVIPFEVKTFNTYGGVASSGFLHAVNLTLNTTTYDNSTIPFYNIFVATWDEVTQGELFDSLTTTNVTVALRNVSQQQNVATAGPYMPIPEYRWIVLDNDANICTNCTTAEGDAQYPVTNNWTNVFRTGGDNINPSGFVGTEFAVDGNWTVNSQERWVTLAGTGTTFDTFIANPGVSTRVDVNVTVRVCAFTFDRPEQPVINANVSLQTEKFNSFGPSTLENLTIYDPYTNAATSSVLTGPSGCATFNISRIDSDSTRGWSTGMPNSIKGTVTKGGSVENVFVGSVSVSCPVGVPCI